MDIVRRVGDLVQVMKNHREKGNTKSDEMIKVR